MEKSCGIKQGGDDMKSKKTHFFYKLFSAKLFYAGALVLLLLAIRKASIARQGFPCTRYSAMASDLGGFGVDVLSGEIDQSTFSGWTDSSPESPDSSDYGQQELPLEDPPAAPQESFAQSAWEDAQPQEGFDEPGWNYTQPLDSFAQPVQQNTQQQEHYTPVQNDGSVSGSTDSFPFFGSEFPSYEDAEAENPFSYNESGAGETWEYGTEDVWESSGAAYDTSDPAASYSSSQATIGGNTGSSPQEGWTTTGSAGSSPQGNWTTTGNAGNYPQGDWTTIGEDTKSSSPTPSPVPRPSDTQPSSLVLPTGKIADAVSASSPAPSFRGSKTPSSTPSVRNAKASSPSPSVRNAKASSPSPSVKSAKAPSLSPSVKSAKAPSPSPSGKDTKTPSPSPSSEDQSPSALSGSTIPYQNSFQYFDQLAPIPSRHDSSKPEISFCLETRPFSLLVSGTEEIGILSFRVNGQETLWHWEGNSLLPDYEPDDGEKATLEIIAVCRGNQMIRWSSYSQRQM